MSSRLVVQPSPDGAEIVIHSSRGHGLTRSGRVLATGLCLVLLLIGALACAWAGVPLTGVQAQSSSPLTAVPAGSTSVFGAPQGAANGAGGGTTLDGAIRATWDGPTTHLAWNGSSYTTAQASFVGDRIAAPGDHIQRTLRVANDGPSAAVLTLSLVVGEEQPEEVRNPDLARGVTLSWNVGGATGSERFDLLLGEQSRQPVIAQTRVAKGETVPITIAVDMSASETLHRNLGASSDLLRFDVLARMQGETAPGVLAQEPGGRLAWTGTTVLAVLAVAVGLLLVGTLLVVAARRRRERCPGDVTCRCYRLRSCGADARGPG